MRRSVVIFGQNNEVPHIASYETHQRSQEISIVTPKRLLQQYRHRTDMPTLLSDVRCWGQSGKHLLAASISPFDPGCVKTSTSRERAELFSLFAAFDAD